ncbi:hypothetical protein HPT27_11910 [Permianibacter sp. IMCC34836]|uniref:holin family protein n=1 Tax=Permianibacter fluminis TaxID=2738515 RepID=UPI00155780A6|nr:holin family protein [Permianibacter fluminis]NQD37732.1 hypothetical protein [Permianibacter fluminis]
MSVSIPGIGAIVEGVGKVADDLFTSDEERLKISLEEKQIEASLTQGQLEVNKAEASNPNMFVAGWRPFIGWVGGFALAYQFLLYPFLTWGWALMQARNWVPANSTPPPPLAADILWTIVTGMLGIAGMRSYDKMKGTDTREMTAEKPAASTPVSKPPKRGPRG